MSAPARPTAAHTTPTSKPAAKVWTTPRLTPVGTVNQFVKAPPSSIT